MRVKAPLRMSHAGTRQRFALLLGMGLSEFGDDIAAIGFSLEAANRNDSGFLAAVLGAQALPTAALALPAGRFADRRGQPLVWATCLLAQALTFAALALAPSKAVILVGVTLNSCLTAITHPTGRKLLAAQSSTSTQGAQNLAVMMGVAQAAGMATGGLAYTSGGISSVLGANALSFLVLAMVGYRMRWPKTRPAQPPQAQLHGGLRLLFSRGLFGTLGVLALACTITGTSIEGVVGIFVLVKHQGLTWAAAGWCFAAWGIGVVLGPFVIQRVPRTDQVRLSLCCMTMGLSLTLLASLHWTLFPLLCIFVVGGCANGGLNTTIGSIIMGSVHTQGQATAWGAFRWISNLCFLVGYCLGGWFGAAHAVAGMQTGGLAPLIAGALYVTTLGDHWARRADRTRE